MLKTKPKHTYRELVFLTVLMLWTAFLVGKAAVFTLRNEPLPDAPLPGATATATASPSPTFSPTPTIMPTPSPAPTLNACQEAWTNGTRAERELGYCWLESYWVPAMIPNRIIYMHMPSYVWGYASQYAPGMMPDPGPGFVGGVSVPFCIEVGKTVWLRRAGVWDGPFKIMDCSRPVGLYTHVVEMGIVVEVDAETAARWGGLGLVSLTTHDPQSLGDRLPIGIRDWFLEQNAEGK